MLKIRLTRKGKKNKVFFRLVVAEHTSPIKGRFLEALGFWNPHTKEKNFKEDRIKYWIGKGAQCSDSAHNMLVSAAIVKGPKRAIKMKKKEEAAEEIKTEEVKEEVKAEPAQKASPNEAGGEKKPDAKTEEKAAPEAAAAETPVEEKPADAPEAVPAEKKEEKPEE